MSILRWLPYPMVRIAGFFVGGVLLGIYLPGVIPVDGAIALVLFLSLGFFTIKLSSVENRFPFTLGLLGLCIIFLMGYVRLHLLTDWRSASTLSGFRGAIESYEAIVRSVPEEKTRTWKMEVEVTAVKSDTSKLWLPLTGRLALYILKANSRAPDFRYGDRILVRGNPQEITPPANPGEFDFKRFFTLKDISRQQFVRTEQVRLVAGAEQRGFIYYSQQVRAWATKKINEYVHGHNERAIVIALVLGVTDGIDNDLLDAYAASGAMHVLAVSGMHVGIIYAIILFLFKGLNKYRWSRWVIAGISLLLLWGFAFVTGLSPSVLRAVTMFSFIALARPFGKQTNIYNTLAASVLFLLIYNPHLILSVGFQLSYLAVLGIVYLQRAIYNLWEIENRVGDWLWQATCISLAAQVATFPLALLYFHQFPSYFLLSNLFVIPLSTGVLVLGILLLVVGVASPLAAAIALILVWLVKALNWIVFKTEALPFSLIDSIHITGLQCWILIGIIVSLVLLFQFRSIPWLYLSFGLTLLFATLQWRHFLGEVNQRQLIVYQIANHRAIEALERGGSVFIADSTLKRDPAQLRLHIAPNRLLHGVWRSESERYLLREIQGVCYFRWGGKTIGLLEHKKAILPMNEVLDCLIVSNNALPGKLLSTIQAKSIIFDGSNSLTYVRSLKEELVHQKIKVYFTRETGAYIF